MALSFFQQLAANIFAEKSSSELAAKDDAVIVLTVSKRDEFARALDGTMRCLQVIQEGDPAYYFLEERQQQEVRKLIIAEIKFFLAEKKRVAIATTVTATPAATPVANSSSSSSSQNSAAVAAVAPPRIDIGQKDFEIIIQRALGKPPFLFESLLTDAAFFNGMARCILRKAGQVRELYEQINTLEEVIAGHEAMQGALRDSMSKEEKQKNKQVLTGQISDFDDLIIEERAVIQGIKQRIATITTDDTQVPIDEKSMGPVMVPLATVLERVMVRDRFMLLSLWQRKEVINLIVETLESLRVRKQQADNVLKSNVKKDGKAVSATSHFFYDTSVSLGGQVNFTEQIRNCLWNSQHKAILRPGEIVPVSYNAGKAHGGAPPVGKAALPPDPNFTIGNKSTDVITLAATPDGDIWVNINLYALPRESVPLAKTPAAASSKSASSFSSNSATSSSKSNSSSSSSSSKSSAADPAPAAPAAAVMAVPAATLVAATSGMSVLGVPVVETAATVVSVAGDTISSGVDSNLLTVSLVDGATIAATLKSATPPRGAAGANRASLIAPGTGSGAAAITFAASDVGRLESGVTKSRAPSVVNSGASASAAAVAVAEQKRQEQQALLQVVQDGFADMGVPLDFSAGTVPSGLPKQQKLAEDIVEVQKDINNMKGMEKQKTIPAAAAMVFDCIADEDFTRWRSFFVGEKALEKTPLHEILLERLVASEALRMYFVEQREWSTAFIKAFLRQNKFWIADLQGRAESELKLDKCADIRRLLQAIEVDEILPSPVSPATALRRRAAASLRHSAPPILDGSLGSIKKEEEIGVRDDLGVDSKEPLEKRYKEYMAEELQKIAERKEKQAQEKAARQSPPGPGVATEIPVIPLDARSAVATPHEPPVASPAGPRFAFPAVAPATPPSADVPRESVHIETQLELAHRIAFADQSSVLQVAERRDSSNSSDSDKSTISLRGSALPSAAGSNASSRSPSPTMAAAVTTAAPVTPSTTARLQQEQQPSPAATSSSSAPATTSSGSSTARSENDLSDGAEDGDEFNGASARLRAATAAMKQKLQQQPLKQTPSVSMSSSDSAGQAKRIAELQAEIAAIQQKQLALQQQQQQAEQKQQRQQLEKQVLDLQQQLEQMQKMQQQTQSLPSPQPASATAAVVTSSASSSSSANSSDKESPVYAQARAELDGVISEVIASATASSSVDGAAGILPSPAPAAPTVVVLATPPPTAAFQQQKQPVITASLSEKKQSKEQFKLECAEEQKKLHEKVLKCYKKLAEVNPWEMMYEALLTKQIEAKKQEQRLRGGIEQLTKAVEEMRGMKQVYDRVLAQSNANPTSSSAASSKSSPDKSTGSSSKGTATHPKDDTASPPPKTPTGKKTSGGGEPSASLLRPTASRAEQMKKGSAADDAATAARNGSPAHKSGNGRTRSKTPAPHRRVSSKSSGAVPVHVPRL